MHVKRALHVNAQISTHYKQVAQLWQRDRAKLDAFSIKVHRENVSFTRKQRISVSEPLFGRGA